jgi:ABC-type multidrug transport system fused ATPase/permease subunit
MDGEPIKDINIQEYRKQIALVSQEPTLYSGTIRFNLLLGAIKPAEEVTQKEIEQACRDVNILEFIQGLPEYVSFHSFHYVVFYKLCAAASKPRLAGKALNSRVVKNSASPSQRLSFVTPRCCYWMKVRRLPPVCGN